MTPVAGRDESILPLRLSYKKIAHLVEALDFEYEAMLKTESPGGEEFPFWRQRMAMNRDLHEELAVALVHPRGMVMQKHPCSISKVNADMGGLNVVCWKVECGCGDFEGVYPYRDSARMSWKRHVYKEMVQSLKTEQADSAPSK